MTLRTFHGTHNQKSHGRKGSGGGGAMTDAEKAAIDNYMNDGYKGINYGLRSRGGPDEFYTETERGIAEGFTAHRPVGGRVLLNIKAKKGQKGRSFAGDLNTYEAEVLLSRGTQMRVTGKRPGSFTIRGRPVKYTEVDVEIVSQNPGL